MSDARNKHIEEMIYSPYNKCSVAYTEDRASKLVIYFIQIKGKRNDIERVMIDEDEVAYWTGVIKKANSERADRKKAVSKERKEKRDRKLAMLGAAETLEDVQKIIPIIDENEEIRKIDPVVIDEEEFEDDDEVAE